MVLDRLGDGTILAWVVSDGMDGIIGLMDMDGVAHGDGIIGDGVVTDMVGVAHGDGTTGAGEVMVTAGDGPEIITTTTDRMLIMRGEGDTILIMQSSVRVYEDVLTKMWLPEVTQHDIARIAPPPL